VAIGAEEAQIHGSVVQPVAVDVVDLKGQRHHARAQSALLADVLASDLDQCAAQDRRLLAKGTVGADDQDGICGKAPRAHAPTCMRLPGEKGGIDPELPDATSDVSLSPTRLAQAEVLQDPGETERCGDGVGEHVSGVPAIARHAESYPGTPTQSTTASVAGSRPAGLSRLSLAA
jgi:hypothetical protein